MNILVVGLNHKTAGVDVREKLAFNGQKLEEGLVRIKSISGIKEAVILSTCNRVEMYANVDNPQKAYESIKGFLSEFHDIERDSLETALYTYENTNAVKHIFRVAASLDSMVVGEPQILGQIKDAFEFSLRKKATGILLNKLMKKAISVAKRIRTETKIAENAVSISFAAVELAKKIFTDLSTKSFMLLGAGDMAELAARHLTNSGVRDVIVANRTYETGCELAKEFNGRAVRFEDFMREMVNTDIVICSTGASKYVLMKEQMQKIIKERKHKPVFIIDISVPRNIDPEINNIDNVYLYDVDDLHGIIDTNKLERQKEAEKAERIIEEEIETFQKWLASLDAVPTIVALRDRADAVKKEEIEKLLNKLPSLGEKEREAVEYMASAIINKLIHPPTTALKEDSEDRDILIAAIRKLYGLDKKEE
ncbi:MAG: glutamyl-tRNA reductase [Thermodesulfovibrionales bacterium]|nr:glutamyl-tRNA reductase [Thermodesulfovibrionales bacterium]